MTGHGPTIPTAIMETTAGKVEVHPAADDWHQKVEVLRYASQRGQLFCPDCGERLKYYSEVRTPHFRHLRDTQGCTNEEKYPDRAHRRREKWFRNVLIGSLRQVFPEGSRFDTDAYLDHRLPYFAVNLPTGVGITVQVVTEKPQMDLWERYKLELASSNQPVFHIFGRQRVKRPIQAAPIGRTRLTIDDGLNADHLDAARSSPVDIAHVARENFFDLPLLTRDPSTLFFFEAGDTPNAPGILTILRGLMPDPTDTIYHGVALRLYTNDNGPNRLRFSERHGFYTADDLDQLRWLRDGFRRRRAKRPGEYPVPSVCRRHPLRVRWERKQSQLKQEHERQQQELERIRAEQAATEARRREQEKQARGEREARIEEQRRQAKEAKQQAQAYCDNLLRILPEEGNRVLAGRTYPVPHPEVYNVPPAVWQAAVLGFAYRAAIPFHESQAAHWLRWRGYATNHDESTARANMQSFWRAVAEDRLVTLTKDRWGDLIIAPLHGTEAFRWPVTPRTLSADRPLALCVICALGDREIKLELTTLWRHHDPVNHLCLCTHHSP